MSKAEAREHTSNLRRSVLLAETRVKPLNTLNEWKSPVDGWQQRDVAAYLRPMSRQEALGRRSPSETRSQPSPWNVRSGVLRWLPPASNTATSPQSSPLIAHTILTSLRRKIPGGGHVSMTSLRFHYVLTVYFLFLFVDGCDAVWPLAVLQQK